MNHNNMPITDNIMKEIFSRISIEKPSDDFTSRLMSKIQEDQVRIIFEDSWLFRYRFYLLSAMLILATLLFIPQLYDLFFLLKETFTSFDLINIKDWVNQLLDNLMSLYIPPDVLTIFVACIILFSLFFITFYPDLARD